MNIHGFPACCGFSIITDLPGHNGLDMWASVESRKLSNETWTKTVREGLLNILEGARYKNFNTIIVLNDKQEKLAYASILTKEFQYVKVSIEKNPNTSLLLHTYIRRADPYRSTEIPLPEDLNV